MAPDDDMHFARRQKVLRHTVVGTAPLVPEVPLRLLRDDSPLWAAFRDDAGADGVEWPYWAFAWGGGQALARCVLDHAELVRGQSVLDFGAGCGITGIAAAMAGARRVEASEIDPIAAAAIEVNAELNEVQLTVWLEDLIYAENPVNTENGGWDVVVAGDLWYNARLARHGVAWLRGLASQGVLVLAGDPGRHYSRSDGLEKFSQFTARSVPDLEHANVQTVSVFRLLPVG